MKAPQKYCPNCDMDGTSPIRGDSCPSCGFQFITSPEEVVWFPSKEGLEVGVVVGSPLYGELGLDTPSEEVVADQPVAPPKRRGRGKARKEKLTPQMRDNRIAALCEFYSKAEATETPYEGGHQLVGNVGPDRAPQTRGDQTPSAVRRQMHDPS